MEQLDQDHELSGADRDETRDDLFDDEVAADAWQWATDPDDVLPW